jgi:SAM-dependent methyltransferase
MSASVSVSEKARQEAEFDEFAGNYDEALNEGLKFTGEGRDYFAAGRVEWLVKRLVVANAHVSTCLDFGCGTGGGCAPLLDGLKLDSYLGYDPSAASIMEARSLPSQKTVLFEHDQQAIPADAVDLVFTNGVFHHIPPAERLSCVQLAWRALKPGGWFAFWENNRWNPIVHFLMSRVPFDKDAQMLFPHQARSLLRAGGFEIVLTDYLFVFPAMLKALRPLEPALCKLPLGGQYMVLARKPLHSEGRHS